jgi:hypothetical protein
MEELWKSKLLLKVRNFLWLVYRGRIQTVDNLRKKRWKGDEKCQFCLESESVDHLVFRCPLSVYIWVVVGDVLGWETLPRSVKNFVDDFLFLRGDKQNEKLTFLFGAISWTLWLNQNDLVFNSKIISSPKALIFKLISVVQHWVIAVTGPDRGQLEQIAEALSGRMDAEREETGVG